MLNYRSSYLIKVKTMTKHLCVWHNISLIFYNLLKVKNAVSTYKRSVSGICLTLHLVPI